MKVERGLTLAQARGLAQELELEDPHRGGSVGMGPVARAAGRAAAAHGDGGRVVRRAEGAHRRAVEHPDGEALARVRVRVRVKVRVRAP